MPKKIKLPPEIVPAAIEDHLKRARDPFARTVLLALKSALDGNAAEACAKSVGKERRWFFELLKRIQQRGLAPCLSRRHGGGMKPNIPPTVLRKMEAEFRAGKAARVISAWLRGQNIHISVEGVNYWKRKLGFVRARKKTKATVREL